MIVFTSAIIAVVAVFLVCHCEYEDGIIGRLALIILALSNGLIVADYLIDRTEYVMLPNTLMTQFGTAMFLARHCYRFMKWRSLGDYQWRPARKG